MTLAHPHPCTPNTTDCTWLTEVVDRSSGTAHSEGVPKPISQPEPKRRVRDKEYLRDAQRKHRAAAKATESQGGVPSEKSVDESFSEQVLSLRERWASTIPGDLATLNSSARG